MTRTLFITCFFLLLVPVRAQEPGYLELVKAENELSDLFQILYSDTLSEPQKILDSIGGLMSEALARDGSMDFPWNRLNRIGVIGSEDGLLKIFTWHLMDDPNHYRYYGFIQVGMKKGRVKLYELQDNHKDQRNVVNLQQSPEDWYGKLYYKIITRNYKKKTVYTLLGMDFNNSTSIIKTIESMAIQRNKPHFEGGQFFDGRNNVDRIVLEYSSQVAMSVRYDPRVEMITYDHLVPFHPVYTGNYEFYGPDGSYDGLEFNEGTWIFRRDIDARNMN